MGIELGRHTGLSSPTTTARVEIEEDSSAQAPLLLASLTNESLGLEKASPRRQKPSRVRRER